MSEYWKSNPKKYCDFCKVWLQDNKSTIQLHEQGKGHKDKVQARLLTIKKRTLEKRAEDKQYNAQMAAIERAAMQSMAKDLENDPTLKRHYGTASTSFVHTATEVKSEAKKKNEPEKRKLVAKEAEKPKSTKIGSWEPTEKKLKEDVTEKPKDLQLPVSDKPQFKPSFIQTMKIEMDNGKVDLDDTDVNKKSTSEKVVTLNSKPTSTGTISFKKRTNTSQSARHRTDD